MRSRRVNKCKNSTECYFVNTQPFCYYLSIDHGARVMPEVNRSRMEDDIVPRRGPLPKT